jgi:hypothetical protein
MLREAKSKRPPTRYGNREDQVLWNKFGSAKQNNLVLETLLQPNSANSISFFYNQEGNLKDITTILT